MNVCVCYVCIWDVEYDVSECVCVCAMCAYGMWCMM